MNGRRVAALTILFAAVALPVVYLRTEQTRSVARTLALETEWVEQRRELWRMHAALARLRSPRRVRDSAAYFATNLVEPGFDDPKKQDSRLVLHGLAD